MSNIKSLEIGNKIARLPIIQGGMGVGISTPEMAGAVAAQGGIGIVSATLANHTATVREGRVVKTYEAVKMDVIKARRLSQGGLIGVNIMIVLPHGLRESIEGARDGGADFIFFGAGLPLNLPHDLVADCLEKNISLIPIISSARAMKIICSRWQSNYNFLPDAVVLEGPLAGGHLGFKNAAKIIDPQQELGHLLSDVLKAAEEYQKNFNKTIKVIAGGGVLTAEDIAKWLKAGADGVQMGTIFVATKESGASDEFKDALLGCSEESIIVAFRPEQGSPCGLPFRLINTSPGYIAAGNDEPNAPCVAYLCSRDKNNNVIKCPTITDSKFFCICNVLLAAVNIGTGKPIFTVGARASEVKEIWQNLKLEKNEYPSVKQVIDWIKFNYQSMKASKYKLAEI